MPETTPLIKAALNLRVGAGFDVYLYFTSTTSDLLNSYPHYSKKITTLYITFVTYNVVTFISFDTLNKTYSCIR